jgi:hypothetical protein
MAPCLPQRMPASHAQFDRPDRHYTFDHSARVAQERTGHDVPPCLAAKVDSGGDFDIRPRHARSDGAR